MLRNAGRASTHITSSLQQALRLSSSSTRAPSSSSSSSSRSRVHRGTSKGKHPLVSGLPVPKANRGARPSPSEGSDGEKRLLLPYTLSARLQKLCDHGELDTAVETLQKAPLDAQNAAVWNNIIREAIKAQRSKLAYQLYVDMKRRGFSPTIRTFLTMFGGFSQMENWPSRTKQIQSVGMLYQNYKDYVDLVKSRDSNSPELTVAPVAGYIKILGDLNQWQKIFDVYYNLDTEGPLKPNHFIYTSIFRALQKRGGPRTSGESSEVHLQNARDVKLLWRQMVKYSQKPPTFPVDSHLISAALGTLALGAPTDQLFAFDILRDHLGLTKPGEEPQPVFTPITSHLLFEVLRLCNAASKHRLCIHYFQQVRDRPLKKGQSSVITFFHMEHVLRAYASLAAMGSLDESEKALDTLKWMLERYVLGDGALRPDLLTFNLVLNACWRGGDWASATTTFELMTGYVAQSFRDLSDGGSVAPVLERRSKERMIQPTAMTISYMVRTAIMSRDKANMRQCMRIVDHLDVDRLMFSGDKEVSNEGEVPTSKGTSHYGRNDQFYASKLAEDLIDLFREASSSEGVTEMEQQRWQAIRKKAKVFRRHPSTKFKQTPLLERSPLGSERDLATTESIVDRDLTRRHMKV